MERREDEPVDGVHALVREQSDSPAISRGQGLASINGGLRRDPGARSDGPWGLESTPKARREEGRGREGRESSRKVHPSRKFRSSSALTPEARIEVHEGSKVDEDHAETEESDLLDCREEAARNQRRKE